MLLQIRFNTAEYGGEVKAQKRGVKSILISIAVLIFLILLTYYLLFKRFEIEEIFKIIRGVDLPFIAIGFAMIFIYLLCYSFFTKLLLGSRGYRIKTASAFRYAAADFYFSAITPSATGGQPFVIYYMNKDGIPVSESFLSTFLHTTLYKVVLLTINLVSAVLYCRVWAGSGWAFISLWFLGLFIAVGVILLTLLSVIKREAVVKFGNGIINILGKVRIVKDVRKAKNKLENSVDEYQKAAKELKGKKSLLVKLFLIVFLQRIAYFSVAFIVYYSLGFTGRAFLYFLAIQSFISLAVDSLPLPGGTGANEVAIILMYKPAFGPEEAAGAMLMIRFINYYFALIVSSAVTIFYQIYNSFKGKKVVK